MGIRRIVFFLALFLFSGCVVPPEPHVVNRRESYEKQQAEISTPQIVAPKSPSSSAVPYGWIPPRSVERYWRGIVVHHSGTPNGNAAIFDRWHREGNHWMGVGYNFVIGNGSDSADGAVEVTFRWQQQIDGAHCKTPDNWANRSTVGICLVGNFNEAEPTAKQMAALRQLVHFLQGRYHIPSNRVYTHQDTPGARVTDCPGRHFQLAGIAQ